MQLPEPHLSPNRWIAQIEKDTVIINPMYHGRGKYVAICWNPTGEKSDSFSQSQEMDKCLKPLFYLNPSF